MPDMTSYLFGDILSVSSGFILYIAAIFTVVVVGIVSDAVSSAGAVPV